MIASGSSPIVIDIQGVTRRFGAKVALNDARLSVPRGCVFGLVGVNGSGKTTLIKHVLGLLRAESGAVRVFERDPAADPVGVLSRIGYLSEEFAVGLFAVLCWLLPVDRATVSGLLLGIALVLPLTRLALAPLALDWNRHR